MKMLVVEDDFTSRLLLQALLGAYGQLDLAENGKEAVAAVANALKERVPYDLVCLDIMMPEMDGQQALKEIRALEERYGGASSAGARILMMTAMHDRESVARAFRGQCDGYLVKPIAKAKLMDYLRELGLIGSGAS
jgi:two-component system, chemotaxis family, chemotaxis protein CheY